MNTIYDFSLTTLAGEEMPFNRFEGKPLLIVNVASKCGLTPQYKGLQALYDEYSDKGLVIVGVPCNQFMQQEPGTPEEIQSFCDTKYGVSFPLTSKIEVNGENRHPLYQWLAGEQAKFPGDITWNFEKFLIDPSGNVVKRFSPKTEPSDKDVISAIEALLP